MTADGSWQELESVKKDSEDSKKTRRSNQKKKKPKQKCNSEPRVIVCPGREHEQEWDGPKAKGGVLPGRKMMREQGRWEKGKQKGDEVDEEEQKEQKTQEEDESRKRKPRQVPQQQQQEPEGMKKLSLKVRWEEAQRQEQTKMMKKEEEGKSEEEEGMRRSELLP